MKTKIKNIIESYCEGINHLEFNIADLDKMADEILALQLQKTGVIVQSEQLVICKKCRSSAMYQYTKTKDKCEDCGNIQDY